MFEEHTLKEGLCIGSSFQHSIINFLTNSGPNPSGRGILSCLWRAWTTSWFEKPGQGLAPLENNSNNNTPNEKTSDLEEALSNNNNSGALHYILKMNS